MISSYEFGRLVRIASWWIGVLREIRMEETASGHHDEELDCAPAAGEFSAGF